MNNVGKWEIVQPFVGLAGVFGILYSVLFLPQQITPINSKIRFKPFMEEKITLKLKEPLERYTLDLKGEDVFEIYKRANTIKDYVNREEFVECELLGTKVPSVIA